MKKKVLIGAAVVVLLSTGEAPGKLEAAAERLPPEFQRDPLSASPFRDAAVDGAVTVSSPVDPKILGPSNGLDVPEITLPAP